MPTKLTRCVGLVGSSACLIGFAMRMPDAFLFDVGLNSSILTPTRILMLTFHLSVFTLILTYFRPNVGVAVAVVLFALCKGRADLVAAPQLTCDVSPCVALVTGANSGIGLAISHALAAQGHEVILGCRSADACAAAAEEITRRTGSNRVTPAGGLDLNSLRKVKRWVAALPDHKRLDFFFANAGIVAVGNRTSEEGVEKALGVCYFGHYAIVHYLRETGRLKSAGGIRKEQFTQAGTTVVTTASDAARVGAFHSSLTLDASGEGDLRGEKTHGCASPFPFCVPPAPGGPARGFRHAPFSSNFGAYPRAKLATILLARELANSHGIRSISVHPGMVHTPMAAQVGEPFATLGGVRVQSDEMQALTMRWLLRAPNAAAAAVLSAAAAARSAPGAYCNARGVPIPEALLPPALRDDETAHRLAEVAVKLIWKASAGRVGAAMPV